MGKSKRIQQRVLFFVATIALVVVLMLAAFVATVNISVEAADEPAPTLAVPPTYTISPTPD